MVRPIPTLIKWDFGGQNVHVMGSWNDYQITPLQASGHTHSVVVPLLPGQYAIYFFVDGALQLHPGLIRGRDSKGWEVNYFCVDAPSPTLQGPLSQKECPAAITFRHESDLVLVEGSWDQWAGSLQMHRSGKDHYLLLSLLPGLYHYRFSVDGKKLLRTDVTFAFQAGKPIANILDVKPEVTGGSPSGAMNAELMVDFMAGPENAVVSACKFNVGSIIGSIKSEEKMCIPTDIGYMILRGFFSEANQAYVRGRSWAGLLQPSDMVVIDGKLCKIRKQPDVPLTRAHILLDNYRFKESLLLRFELDGQYPPYFSHLFWFLENPPEDFDSNQTSRDAYIDNLYKSAALGTPPERMMALVNIAQYYKTLPEDDKLAHIQRFNKLMNEYSDWFQTAYSDALLKAVYLDTRPEHLDANGQPLPPLENSGLYLSNFIRVFFVHGPEHSLVDLNAPTQTGAAPSQSGKGGKIQRKRRPKIMKSMQQLLKSYTESDLIIAYYYDQLVAQLLVLVRENVQSHPLVKATWHFYCGGCPPNNFET